MTRKFAIHFYALILGLICCTTIKKANAQAVPTDNPIASFYTTGQDYPA